MESYQIVDAFFAKPKKESVFADLPLGKDKNKKDTNQKTEVNHYEKLEKGVIGQKITLVAECDNLEGKDVTIYIYEKKPLLEAKDTKLKVIQNDKEVEKICATVKDGYAVAEIQLQKPDSAKYKAWDKKLDPDTGDEKSSELYLKVVVEGVDSPATNKEFLKTGKKKFELRAVIFQHIYHNGEISKEYYEGVDKIKYVYHDKKGNKHNIYTGELSETWKKSYGATTPTLTSAQKLAAISTIDYKAMKVTGVDAYKSYVLANNDVYTEGRDVAGYTHLYYKASKEKIAIVAMPSNGLNYSSKGITIKFSWHETLRKYSQPHVFAAFIGALAECGFTDVKSTGSSYKDGSSYPSKTHNNGYAIDTQYFMNNDGSLNLEKEQKLVTALYKFGFIGQIKGSSTKFSKLTDTKSSNSRHNDHLHSGGAPSSSGTMNFKPNYRK